MNYINYAKGKKEGSVAVVKDDGTLMYVFTEERYSRKKYDCKIPFNSIKSMSKYIDRDLLFCHYPYDKEVVDLFKLYFPNNIFKEITKPNHHLLHCYESFYTSGFSSAAILVVDGCGSNDGNDLESISIYHKIGKETKLLKKYYIKDSLGLFYGTASYFLGFNENEEGHFMGLSSYGTPFEKRYATFNNGNININFGDDLFIYNANHNTLECINSINFAATAQRDMVECLLGLVRYIKDLTGGVEENLCLSGGVFNNVLANNTICESGIFKNVWCSPAPGDYGISVGKAYLSYEHNTDDNNLLYKKMEDAYLGEEFDDEMIIKYLNKNKIEYSEVSVDKIADLLVNDKIIAWFQGRSEYGRRALGHRSILSNPLYKKNYTKVSKEIKHRAPYRPLACTVPDVLFDMVFDVKNKDLTEYMLRAIPVRKEMREKMQACVAIDNTTRPQNLHRKINPEFYDMIMSFYKKTGVPAVVNTSLNGGGEPIVENLNDLFKFCKEQKNIDYIVLNGKYLLINDTNIMNDKNKQNEFFNNLLKNVINPTMFQSWIQNANN